MIYISYSDSKDSLKDFLKEYTESTYGSFRGKGIIGQMEEDSIKSDWCFLNCPISIDGKVFERLWEKRQVHCNMDMDHRTRIVFDKILKKVQKNLTQI